MGARVTGSGKARGPLGSLKDLMGAKGDGSLVGSWGGLSRVLRGGWVGGGGGMWRLVASLALSASVWWAERGRRSGGRRGVEGEAMEEAGKDPNKGNQTKRKKERPVHTQQKSEP